MAVLYILLYKTGIALKDYSNGKQDPVLIQNIGQMKHRK
jgi:hypothetical protein